MDAAELKSRTRALQTAQSDAEIIDILKSLRDEAKISEKLLRETKAGLAVGKLRTHNSRDIAELAKEVVKKWKNEVDKEKESTASSPSPGPHNGVKHEVKKEASRPTPISTNNSSAASSRAPSVSSPSTPKGTTANSNARTAARDGVKFAHTGERTRDTCACLIYDALASDSTAPSDLIEKRARAIEEAVYRNHSYKVTPEYRNKMRSLFSNLKDKNNPGLRESVVSGDLAAPKLATMSTKDMASEERKAADEKIRQEAIFNTLAAGEAEAETDAFQCSKCKERKTRYRQAQTRSADEPMTTFITCTNCGNKWKFS